MATATNDTSANGIYKASAAKERFRASRGPGLAWGVKTYKQVIALVAGDLDASDETPVFAFPDNTYLLRLDVKSTDLDTDGTPAVLLDFITEDSAGTEVVLINDSTIGQAGGNDELDTNLDPSARDVSNKSIKLKVATAPDAAQAGTLTAYATVVFGGVITSF
jgi:hypothetical protein